MKTHAANDSEEHCNLKLYRLGEEKKENA